MPRGTSRGAFRYGGARLAPLRSGLNSRPKAALRLSKAARACSLACCRLTKTTTPPAEATSPPINADKKYCERTSFEGGEGRCVTAAVSGPAERTDGDGSEGEGDGVCVLEIEDVIEADGGALGAAFDGDDNGTRGGDGGKPVGEGVGDGIAIDGGGDGDA